MHPPPPGYLGRALCAEYEQADRRHADDRGREAANAPTAPRPEPPPPSIERCAACCTSCRAWLAARISAPVRASRSTPRRGRNRTPPAPRSRAAAVRAGSSSTRWLRTAPESRNIAPPSNHAQPELQHQSPWRRVPGRPLEVLADVLADRLYRGRDQHVVQDRGDIHRGRKQPKGFRTAQPAAAAEAGPHSR